MVTECRKSGLIDTTWGNEYGIAASYFCNAVICLRKKVCQTPDPVGKASTLDLISHKQDVVHIVAIGSEFSPAELIPDGGGSMHFDNSHTIEIESDGLLIRMSNEIKPMLVLVRYSRIC